MNWQLARIGKRYRFSASHQLTGVPSEHPCAKLHGHNYTIEIEVRGEINPITGFVVDFNEIDEKIKPIIKQLDHSHLNDTIDNPTAENIAAWIMGAYPVKYLYSVKVWETEKCWAQVINSDGLYSRAHKE